MLSPDTRRLYTDCFRAPPGGTFDCAVGTTFTLDFEALLYVPLALASHGFDDPVAALREPLALLQGISRVAERLTVFCQDGYSNAPEIHHPLLSLLEDSYAPSRARKNGGIFHPKLWLIRFVEGDSVLLRAVVLSRNLTTSRCWDTLVCLEGTPHFRRRVPESAGLAQLVAALPGLMTGAKLSAARLAQVASLADEVARTEFLAPPPFDETTRVEFVALGLADRTRWAPTHGDRVLGISPFVSDGALRKLAALAPSRALVGREESLATLSPSTLEGWQASHLVDTASADADSAQDEVDGDTADSLPHGLHAKALAIEAGKHTTWWLGSANHTDAAIDGTNVELLIKLEGTRKRVGIDAFLEGFSKYLTPFTPPATPPTSDDNEAACQLAEHARRVLALADLTGQCVQDDPAQGWSLRIQGAVAIPADVRVEAWPLTLPDATALPWAGGVTFKGLAVESLTAFVAFRVEATANAEKHRVTFTRKLPVEGFPEDRRQRIMRSVIRDQSAFLSYLRHVLAGIEGNAQSGFADIDPLDRRGTNDRRAANAPLLERMLRALRRDPQSLAAIDQTIQGLRSGDMAGDDVVPADFLALWNMLLEVMPERTGDRGRS